MTDEEEAPFIWSIPEPFPQGLIGVYDRQRSPDRFAFRKGEPLPEGIGTPVFIFRASLEDLQAWDVLPNDAMLPLVGGRVAAILMQEAITQTQLLDAVVEHRGGVSRDRWKLVNVTTSVQAIDHALSKYTLVRGTKQVLGFTKLRYRPGALDEAKIARDAEYKSHILVSPSLAAALSGVRGLGLRKADDL